MTRIPAFILGPEEVVSVIPQEEAGEAAKYATAGFTFAGTILVFGGVGYAVDHWLGLDPWMMVLGLVLGAIGGFVHLVSAFSGKATSGKANAKGSSRRRDR